MLNGQVPLPDGWTAHTADGTSDTYYFNESTNVTQWQHPATGVSGIVEADYEPQDSGREESKRQSILATSGDDAGGTLPPNWVRFTDAEGTPYYYNSETEVTQWDLPTGTALLQPDDVQEFSADDDSSDAGEPDAAPKSDLSQAEQLYEKYDTKGDGYIQMRQIIQVCRDLNLSDQEHTQAINHFDKQRGGSNMGVRVEKQAFLDWASKLELEANSSESKEPDSTDLQRTQKVPSKVLEGTFSNAWRRHTDEKQRLMVTDVVEEVGYGKTTPSDMRRKPSRKDLSAVDESSQADVSNSQETMPSTSLDITASKSIVVRNQSAMLDMDAKGSNFQSDSSSDTDAANADGDQRPTYAAFVRRATMDRNIAQMQDAGDTADIVDSDADESAGSRDEMPEVASYPIGLKSDRPQFRQFTIDDDVMIRTSFMAGDQIISGDRRGMIVGDLNGKLWVHYHGTQGAVVNEDANQLTRTEEVPRREWWREKQPWKVIAKLPVSTTQMSTPKKMTGGETVEWMKSVFTTAIVNKLMKFMFSKGGDLSPLKSPTECFQHNLSFPETKLVIYHVHDVLGEHISQSQVNANVARYEWDVGSQVEVFSSSSNSWCAGKVKSAFVKTGNLQIQYKVLDSASGKVFIHEKELHRMDPSVRLPSLPGQVKTRKDWRGWNAADVRDYIQTLGDKYRKYGRLLQKLQISGQQMAQITNYDLKEFGVNKKIRRRAILNLIRNRTGFRAKTKTKEEALSTHIKQRVLMEQRKREKRPKKFSKRRSKQIRVETPADGGNMAEKLLIKWGLAEYWEDFAAQGCRDTRRWTSLDHEFLVEKLDMRKRHAKDFLARVKNLRSEEESRFGSTMDVDWIEEPRLDPIPGVKPAGPIKVGHNVKLVGPNQGPMKNIVGSVTTVLGGGSRFEVTFPNGLQGEFEASELRQVDISLYRKADRKYLRGPRKPSKPKPRKGRSQMTAGTRVRVSGLKKASEYNGQSGTIRGRNARSGEWLVVLDLGKKVALKSSKLELLSQSRPPPPPSGGKSMTKWAPGMKVRFLVQTDNEWAKGSIKSIDDKSFKIHVKFKHKGKNLKVAVSMRDASKLLKIARDKS